MARVYPQAWFGDGLAPVEQATLSITSAAVLYGLSVYTVLPVTVSGDGTPLGFRLSDHYRRLVNSERIIGIDTWEPAWSEAALRGGPAPRSCAPTRSPRTSSCA